MTSASSSSRPAGVNVPVVGEATAPPCLLWAPSPAPCAVTVSSLLLPHNGRDGAGDVQGMANKKNRNGEFWELALERAHLGVWDWDLRTGDCFYSAMWSQMLGYGEGELAETSFGCN